MNNNLLGANTSRVSNPKSVNRVEFPKKQSRFHWRDARELSNVNGHSDFQEKMQGTDETRHD